MIKVEGYKIVEYLELQKKLHNAFEQSEKNHIQIAVEVGIKSSLTIKNAFNLDEKSVSDKVLTQVMKNVGVDGFIVWVKGERRYYLSNN